VRAGRRRDAHGPVLARSDLPDEEQAVVRYGVRDALLEIIEDHRTLAWWRELFASDRAALEKLVGQFVQDRLAECMTVTIY
jgi:hypothetical protein